jgi:hypothetical protein
MEWKGMGKCCRTTACMSLQHYATTMHVASDMYCWQRCGKCGTDRTGVANELYKGNR